ncbi:hypothetical protein [Amycolatopsis nigrescens]|uniref:hypothetical protein n=1 Tax=Amycolatopsis nigrescens TaxID=381445 RepID=UPI0012F885AD|nr:hypothetical protein [Amycolatopsis nigrescens]
MHDVGVVERAKPVVDVRDEVDALAGRMSPDNGLLTITDAYTGLHRRSNFRRRTWLPALAGDEKNG